jgi:hypothetical protein
MKHREKSGFRLLRKMIQEDYEGLNASTIGALSLNAQVRDDGCSSSGPRL